MPNSFDSSALPKPPIVPPADTPSVHPARLWWQAVLVVFFALSNIAFFPTITQIDPPGPGALIQIMMGMEMGSVFASCSLSFFAVLGPG